MRIDAMGADVVALADSWDLVVGHSLGGTVALSILLDQPNWASRVVMEDPALMFGQTDAVVDWLLAPFTKPLTREQIAADGVGWEPFDVDVKVDALRSCSPATVRRTIEQSAPFDVRSHLKVLTMPTLLLGADPKLGALVTPEIGIAAANDNPMIIFEPVAGGSHSMHRQAFAAFWEPIATFLS